MAQRVHQLGDPTPVGRLRAGGLVNVARPAELSQAAEERGVGPHAVVAERVAQHCERTDGLLARRRAELGQRHVARRAEERAQRVVLGGAGQSRERV